MRWFKHFTDSLDDPFIQELLEEFGAQGYLAYFGLLEIIAKENGNKLTGKLRIRPTYLRQKLHISSTKLQQIFNFCSTSLKLSVNFSEKLWNFNVPKLLDLKDNYSKDLQAPCKNVSNHKEVEEEKEKTLIPSFQLATLLAEKVLQNNPKNRELQPLKGKKETTINRWAIDIDKMLRLDKRDASEIEEVIEWCQADSFWSGNILSGEKLRKQYDQLVTKKDKTKTKPISILDRKIKELEETGNAGK